ncbi:eCIS core domain-containing protein [Streptomyces sp. NBC_01477]|uniref:eCIS core domain-containing protein n=1 Tax=Streptomyces sp. NBC_01477 TaxID=2976015 RepID=UPI002E3244EB|nr:DUF4157 domain-containing protein [Streptomyces sp. NBC_01477]
MHANGSARSNEAENSRSSARTPTGRAATPLPPLLALQGSAGNAAVVQMLRRAGHPWAQERHRHNAGCGHQQAEQPVQRSTVPDVLRSPGRPLDDNTRTEMEARLDADFSDVRLHTDTTAQASAAEVGARAYTSGNHVVIGEGGGDKHTLVHELTHVIQQRSGPVAGTDNGQGLSLSHPSDVFEREAEANAQQIMAGGPSMTIQRSANPSGGDVAVQRYVEIDPGTANYPTQHKKAVIGPAKDADGDEKFFPSQHEENGSYYAGTDPLAANITYNGSVRLRISDNYDLAVEQGSGESKVFFAAEQHIAAANEALTGRVRLHQGKRFLRMRGETGEKRLFQVKPVVENTASELAKAGRGAGSTGGLAGLVAPKTKKTTGLSVLTPQRCNEMADFVSGRRDVAFNGTTAWDNFLAKVLDIVHSSGEEHLNTLETARREASSVVGDNAAYFTYTQRMSREFQDLKDADSPELEEALEQLGLNDFLPPPAPGSVVTTVGYGDAQQEDARDRDRYFEYHFGTVVATSGHDYVTMENYARRDPAVGNDTLSSGDPLFFFRMYGTRRELGETWHSYQVGTGGFIGAALSITLEG